MRILITHWHRAVIGGAESYLRAAAPELERRGYEIGLLHGYTLDPRSKAVDWWPSGRPSWSLEQLGGDAALSQIENWSPDLVYAHHWEDQAVEARLLAQYRCVLFVHDYHRTCPTGRKCHSFPQIRACARRAGSACLSLHYPRRCGGLNPLTMVRDFQRQSNHLELAFRYDRLLAASRYMRDELAQHGADASRLEVLPLFPPGMEPDREPPVFRLPGNHIVVAGRLTPLKGAQCVLEAMPAASRELGRALRVTILGAGAYEADLRSLAAARHVDAKFAGWLDRTQIAEIIRHADLLAASSLWPEPFGLVGVEAGCSGLPAVAYDVGGVRDWLRPGVSGEIAPADPPTTAGLANAMIRALRDPEHYNDLRRGAWDVSREYSSAAHFDGIDRVFESVANRTALA